MPPKAKYSRKEIIEAALELVAKRGIEALTARDLGAYLETSTRPIFTAFKSMEELDREVRKAAMERFSEFADRAKEYTPIFKQVGLQMIMFAAEQPKLFQLLFMNENSEAKSFEDIFESLGETASLCVVVIKGEYGLDEEHAMMLFKHCWIYTFGVGVMIATKACSFTEDEISDMLSREFVAMLTLIKMGRADNCTTVPERK